ncbi:MAG: hypothetical protein Q8P20_04815 [bacterium]|nr:hypothetical protein [bacterium]
MKKTIFILLFLIIVVAIIFFLTVEPKKDTSNTNISETEVTNINTNSNSNVNITNIETTDVVRWDNFGEGYIPSSTPPECPDPLVLQTPVDLNKVYSILYPGQERGGDFKPHGGFRFADGTDDEIRVTIPMDARLLEGVRYYENDYLQYMFSFINNCGIMYRFDHLATLSEELEEIVSELPEPKVDDTRTYHFLENYEYNSGDVIATTVGEGDNVFVDWGVYDLRQKNGVNIDQFDSLAEYGICWFDLLPTEDETIVRSLPAGDSTSGANSKYCL